MENDRSTLLGQLLDRCIFFFKHVLIQIKDLIFISRATNGDQLAEDILDRCITSKGGHEVNIDIIDV